LERILSVYAPQVIAYDAIAQLKFEGVDAYGAHWKRCLGMCSDPMTFELREGEIAASGDLAFCHGLLYCGGTDEHGEEKAGWIRATQCLRRIDGAWRIVHEHFSAPFDMGTGMAMLDLRP
jgi:ketosteroid isomerase-like protein